MGQKSPPPLLLFLHTYTQPHRNHKNTISLHQKHSSTKSISKFPIHYVEVWKKKRRPTKKHISTSKNSPYKRTSWIRAAITPRVRRYLIGYKAKHRKNIRITLIAPQSRKKATEMARKREPIELVNIFLLPGSTSKEKYEFCRFRIAWIIPVVLRFKNNVPPSTPNCWKMEINLEFVSALN